MTSLPPRPPPASGVGGGTSNSFGPSNAFSVRELRDSLQSRARDLETKASDAAAAMQKRLSSGSLFEGNQQEIGNPKNAFVELARRPAKQVADTATKLLTSDDNALIRGVKTSVRSAAVGMRRVRTADDLSNGSIDEGADGSDSPQLRPQLGAFQLPPRLAAAPSALREKIDQTLPEWDVFKSLKCDGTGGKKSFTKWTPPQRGSFGEIRQYIPGSNSGQGLDDLLRNIEAKIEQKMPGVFSKESGGFPTADFTPSELLSKVHDAGNAAVREWLSAAREKTETAGGPSTKSRSRGKMNATNRAASMTEAEFREAEAAARLIQEMRNASGADTDVGGDEEKYGVSSSPTSPTSQSSSPATSPTTTLTAMPKTDEVPTDTTSDLSSPQSIATLPKPADERRRLSTDAVSGTGRTDITGFGPIDTPNERKSMRSPGRSVAIVTTASLPWMTGTAVNPLLRAAYLSKRGGHDVTLVVPWLPPEEQQLIHPSVVFETPEQQDTYVRKWVIDRCGFDPTSMKLDFYPGRYAKDKYSIIPVGDVSKYIKSKNKDVAVLEEPEHLNWYHSGNRWSDTFEHVVGVVHTNYLEYARLEEHGKVKEAAMRFVNSWVSRMHCHKIIKLSDAVQDFPRSETVNVHGVSPVFLEVGRRKATAAAQASAAECDPDAAAAQVVGRTVSKALASLSARSERRKNAKKNENKDENDSETLNTPEPIHPSKEVFTKGCYFLGKVVWGKGFHELLQRVEEHNVSSDGAEFKLEMDVFGSGEDFGSVCEKSKEKNLPLNFKGRADHASDQMHDYKVFINPSLSDVVATTSAEALAMGKYVICAKHASNAFFSTFPNCLTYDSPEEFSKCVKKALSSDPTPLSVRDRYRLSWEAATDRFLDAAELGAEQTHGPGSQKRDRIAEAAAHALHSSMARAEPLRRAAGAGENTMIGPEVVDGKWTPPWVRRG